MDMLVWLNLYVAVLSATLLTVTLGVLLYWRFVWIKAKVRGIFQGLHIHWRTRQAQRIVKHVLLEREGLIVPIDAYNSCFIMGSTATGRPTWGEVIPDGSKWLNDYFIASALEALSQEEQVVKTEILRNGDWPPRAVSYLFQPKRPGESVEARRKEIETNNRCYQYQRWVQQCPLTYRFEAESQRLLESAVPCERCWE